MNFNCQVSCKCFVQIFKHLTDNNLLAHANFILSVKIIIIIIITLIAINILSHYSRLITRIKSSSKPVLIAGNLSQLRNLVYYPYRVNIIICHGCGRYAYAHNKFIIAACEAFITRRNDVILDRQVGGHPP